MCPYRTIIISWATRTLELFAKDQETLDLAVQQIKLYITRTALVQRIITSDRRLMRSLQTSGALATLKYRFEVAGQVLLDTKSSRYILKHHESSSPDIRALLATHKAQIEGYQRSIRPHDESEASCPICQTISQTVMPKDKNWFADMYIVQNVCTNSSSPLQSVTNSRWCALGMKTDAGRPYRSPLSNHCFPLLNSTVSSTRS